MKAEFSRLFRASLPLAWGYLGGTAIGLTDQLMLGRLGAEALAAAGLALAVYLLVGTVGWGLVFPVLILVAQARKGRDEATIAKIVVQGLWVAALFCVPASVVLWNLERILLWSRQDPALCAMAGEYMRAYVWTLFPMIGVLVLSNAFTALERTGRIARVLWLQVVLNAFLDAGLIFGHFGFPRMEMAGAGWASVLVQTTGGMILFVSFAREYFLRDVLRPDRVWMLRILRLGVPKSFEMVMRNGLNSTLALAAGFFGVLVITAHSIALQTFSLTTSVLTWAVAHAVTARVSAIGRRGNPRRILDAGVALFLVLLAPLLIVLWFFPRWVVVLFLGAASGSAASLPAASLLGWAGVLLLVDGLRTLVSQALGGLEDLRVPAGVTSAACCVAFPLGLVLAFVAGFGAQGLWAGAAFGLGAAAVVLWMRWRRVNHPGNASRSAPRAFAS